MACGVNRPLYLKLNALGEAGACPSHQSWKLPFMNMKSTKKVRSLALAMWMMTVAVVLQPLQVFGLETVISPIAPPEITAEAIYVADATTGIPLYSKNPDERRPIGSIVKIITALVTLKHIEDPDNTQVKIIEGDQVEPGYSTMNLQIGDTLTVTQLLYGLMLPSGGDAANALCRYVGGVISGVENRGIACESFVNEMNAYAAELGLDNSRFTNPDGRDADNAYSSAQDVYVMTEAMTKNEKLMAIATNSAYRFNSVGPENREYVADSTLQPHMTNGIIGGKTGSEVMAGGNVSAIRDVNGGSNKVIIVVMGSTLAYDENTMPTTDTRWDDVNAIVAAMDSQFTWTNPAENGVIPGLSEQMIVWDVQLQSPPAIPVPSGAGVNIAFQMQVGPVVESGQPAGTLYLYYGETQVGHLPLYQSAIGWQQRQAA